MKFKNAIEPELKLESDICKNHRRHPTVINPDVVPSSDFYIVLKNNEVNNVSVATKLHPLRERDTTCSLKFIRAINKKKILVAAELNQQFEIPIDAVQGWN